MNQASEKRLQRLHPVLTTALRAVISELDGRGLTFEVVQGLRTFAEQDALYEQGRTTPGPIVTQARGGESNHNYGLAADLCPFVDGRPDWNAPMKVWTALGTTAAARGLEWGGGWKKFLDKPHVQLPSLTVAECQRAFADGGLDAVWARATSRLEAGGVRKLTRPPRRKAARRKVTTRKIAKRKLSKQKVGKRKVSKVTASRGTASPRARTTRSKVTRTKGSRSKTRKRSRP